MYRAFLCFALLAFCSSAPYGDVNAPRTFPVRQEQQFIQQQPLFQQQTVTVPRIQHHQQQQDQTDLVDTLGGGYSFFKKQPIVSRPLIQQKMAISEQQVPIVSLDDTTNQWSDYTKASAFKQLPIQKQQVSASNDLLVGGGYGQQQQQQQQQDLGIQMSLAPKTLVSERQGAYGSALAQDQQGLQQIVQQQPIIQQQQQPSVRNFDSGYGQQNVQTFAQEQQPVQVLRPLIRNLENSYGQQQPQQPLGASVQFNQPTFSAHHTEFSHQNAPVMSSRVISQSQVPVQSSDSGSFRGW